MCEYKTEYKSALNIHMKSDHVGALFTRNASLKTHQQGVHEGIKHPCRKCDYQATTKGNLEKHNQRVHESIKYYCYICDNQYTTRVSLRKHTLNIHEGVKY